LNALQDKEELWWAMHKNKLTNPASIAASLLVAVSHHAKKSLL
jgi:hypothetical protein